MTRRRAVDVGIRKAWSPAEAAGLLGLSYKSVLAEIHAGRIKAGKGGRCYVIPDAEIDRWLAEAVEAHDAERGAA